MAGEGALGPGSQPAFTPYPPAPRKVQHKNLVRLLGVILHQGLYIVMEHVSKVGQDPRVVGAGGSRAGGSGWGGSGAGPKGQVGCWWGS